MNKKVRITLALMACFILAALLWQGVPLQASGKIPGSASLVEGNTTFALELYQELKSAEGNLFFSPYSISTALAMTYAGARGETAAQMADALNFSLPEKELHPAFGRLEAGLNAVQAKGDIRLHVANSLWPQQDYSFLKEYLTLVKKHYGVTITPLDYKRAVAAAREKINQWVEKKTENKIKKLIQPGILNALTRMVLVNAIYFKGNWANQFDPKYTKDTPFYLLSGKTAQVRMMTRKERYRYTEQQSLQVLELPYTGNDLSMQVLELPYTGNDLSMQVLELPYTGNDLSMLVLLPRKKDGVPELEKQLTVKTLKQWTAGLRKQKVKVLLPKFKITSQFRLDKPLVDMGMVDAFDSKKANFSGMNGNKDLFIGAVLHKAFVDVNEEGTEAAASTAVRIATAIDIGMTPIFRADHPFLFLIKDNKTGSILFMGRLLDPGQKGE